MEQTSSQPKNPASVLCVSGILAAVTVLFLFQLNEYIILLLVLYLPVQFLIAYGVYKGKVSAKGVQLITLAYLLISLFTIIPAAIYCATFIYASSLKDALDPHDNKVKK
jgi:heme/copper-type cytochrome/quinol oxidase subunit 2